MKKMKTLIIIGNAEEVKKIINSLIERYGNIPVSEYLKKMKKDRVVLV